MVTTPSPQMQYWNLESRKLEGKGLPDHCPPLGMESRSPITPSSKEVPSSGSAPFENIGWSLASSLQWPGIDLPKPGWSQARAGGSSRGSCSPLIAPTGPPGKPPFPPPERVGSRRV